MSDPAAPPPAEEAPLANAPQHFEPADVPFVQRPAASPDRVIHLIGNAHLDVVWLWPWQEGYQEARATFRSVLDRMDEYPDFRFTCDQVVLLSWVQEQDPELFERIRARVAQGRWVNTGGWWVEPDCNLPTGESFVRQGLYGQRFLQQRFGRPATVGMNVDPFGHAATLPQVLAGQGLSAYCFLRPMAAEKALPSPLFRWRGPDGTEVLGFRIPFEYQSSRETVDRHVEKAVAEFSGHLGERLPETMVFFGVGNHGGGPTIRQIETAHRYDRMGSFGTLPLSDPETYFARVRERGLVADLPVVDGDLQHHSAGCYSAQSAVKQWQRRAQTAVLVAERWAAAAALLHGTPVVRADLERAWKQILLNQVHDVLPGTAIEVAYEDARDQLGEAIAVAKRITARAHNRIAASMDVPLDPSTQPVVVFNHHPWPVTATVELHLGFGMEVDPAAVTDPDGAVVPAQTIPPRAEVGRRPGGSIAFQAHLPPFGVARYALHAASGFDAGAVANQPDAPERPRPAPAAPAPSLLTRLEGRSVLENAVLRAEVDHATGWLTGLLDKRSGEDLLAGARGPHLQVCEDPTDTWGHRVVSYAWPGAEMPVTRVLVREDGPLRARIRVERAWHRSTLAEDFVLTVGSDALEVRVELDWHEPMHLLKWRVPVALSQPAGRVEIPFGSIERGVTGAEEPGQSWIDVTEGEVGLAVVNDAKHAYDLSPATAEASASIGVTAVRSPPYAWHDPSELDLDAPHAYQDQGFQRFTVLLAPHGPLDTADLHRRAAELTMRPRAMLESFHEGDPAARASWASASPASVAVTAIKLAEDSDDLIVRAVETSGSDVDAVIALPLVDAEIRTRLPARSIRTWRVPRGGPAVEVDLLEQDLSAT